MFGRFANTNWRAQMQGASKGFDVAFGEDIRIIPAKPYKPNFSPSPDEGSGYCTRGVFSYADREVRLGMSEAAVQSRDPVCSFHRNNLRFALNVGDFIERCDGARFQITSVKPDGVIRIDVDLVQIGAQRQ